MYTYTKPNNYVVSFQSSLEVDVDSIDLLIYNFTGFCDNCLFMQKLSEEDRSEVSFYYSLRVIKNEVYSFLITLRNPIGRLKYLIIPNPGSDSSYYTENFSEDNFPSNYYNRLGDGWKDYYYTITRGCIQLSSVCLDVKSIGFTHIGPDSPNMLPAMLEAIKHWEDDITLRSHNYYFFGCGFSNITKNQYDFIFAYSKTTYRPFSFSIINNRWRLDDNMLYRKNKRDFRYLW